MREFLDDEPHLIVNADGHGHTLPLSPHQILLKQRRSKDAAFERVRKAYVKRGECIGKAWENEAVDLLFDALDELFALDA
jgi:hypothetical protein